MAGISFPGLASGIDTSALIKASSDATRQERETPLQNKVTDLTNEDTALSTVKTKLTAIQTAAAKFATINGGGLVKQGLSNDETKVTATASNAAQDATYSVTVSALAKNGTTSLGPASGTYTSELSTISAGTSEVITVGTGSNLETITVPITAGTTTLNDFITSFNNQSKLATATTVNVGTSSNPSYKIVITSNYSGTEKGTIAVSTNAAGFASPTASAATDAVMTIGGIGTITRSSNAIGDVITGVTFNLQAVGSATVSVADDVSGSSALVQDMVDAWNDYVTFMNTNNTVTRQSSSGASSTSTNLSDTVTNVYGPLAKTRVDDNALSDLRTALGGTTYSKGSTVKIFADFGVTTNKNDGTLLFDTSVFKTAMAAEPSSVGGVLTRFADHTALTADGLEPTKDGVIYGYIKPIGLIDTVIKNNQTNIGNMNDQIAQVEAQISQTEASQTQRYAALEGRISQLQSQQATLTSSLASLR